MNQLQPEVIHQILKQGQFQDDQEYEIQQILNYIDNLIQKEFPRNIINSIRTHHPLHQNGNYFTIQDLVDMIMKEYSRLNELKQEATNQILFYQNEYKKIKDQLEQARKEEKLNEFEIDVDSALIVTVQRAQCLISGQYHVILKLFNNQKQTQVSQLTDSPMWNEEFEINVPSPHGQLFVGLFLQDKLIGQLQLPLYQFKDQQHFTQDYILENQYGVLINTKLKLNLTMWWVHSKVALLDDHLALVNGYKKEIGEQQKIIDNLNYDIEYLLFTFNRNRIIRIQVVQQQQQQQQQQIQSNLQESYHDIHWTIQFQDCMFSISKIFKSDFQDSIEEWQNIVIFLSAIISLFSTLFVMISRPCMQQLVISLSIAMLVWAYQSNPIRTTKILSQIALILLFQCIFDSFWLIINYKLWWTKNFDMEQQLIGKFILNELSYYCTMIYVPLDLILSACTFNLSLKYLTINNIEF